MLNQSQSNKAKRGRLSRLALFVTFFALVTWSSLGASVMFASAAEASRTVYVTNVASRTVSAYAVGPGGGLSSVPGSPFKVGIAPIGVAMTPDAEHLYVPNLESDTVSAFEVAPNGGLTPVPGSPFASSSGPWGVAVSPDGDHLYVANRSANRVSGYSIAPDGSLSPVPGSPFKTGSAPGGMSSNGVAVTPDGEHLYVTNMGGSGSVTGFSIATDGSLSPVSEAPFDAGQTARPVSVSPDGKHLYVGTSDENIWAYAIGSEGGLSPVAGSPFFTEGQSLGLAISPDGAHLYGAHVGGGNNVWGYSIGLDGGLSPLAGAPFPTGSRRGNSAVVSPDGKYLYSTNSAANNISAYSVSGTGGLSLLPGSPFPATGIDPLQMTITPDQGPVAAFSASPTPAGNPLSLDASSSSDSDGKVARYHWDFGDGQTEVTSSAKAAHVYESADDYTVTLTVTDNSGCSTTQTFTGQTVSCNGSPLAQVSHEITVPPGVPLSVSRSGSGSGLVTSSPSGVACPGECSYSFEPGTQVTLTADPEQGSSFTGWSGVGCSGAGTCEVNMAEAEAVEAEFTLNTHSLDVITEGTGAGEVGSSPIGITECGKSGGTCQASYDYGTAVALTADPAEGSTFTGWSGVGCSGIGTCRITVGGDTEVTAAFGKIPPTDPPPGQPPGGDIEDPPVSPQLRIARVRSLPLRPLKVVVGGTVAGVARGAVSIKVSTRVNGRRFTATKRARIRDGRWRARLVLAGVKPDLRAAIRVTVRFPGSPGVLGGEAKRRLVLK